MKTPTIELQNLEVALRGLGWKTPEIKTLFRSDRLNNLRSMLELSPHLLSPSKTIDLSGSVDVPGLSVNWNQKQKRMVWNPDSFTLFQTEAQAKGKDVGWTNHTFFVRDNYSPVNACLLDYLLECPHLIPRSWRYCLSEDLEEDLHLEVRNICFLGTTYLDQDRKIFVRGMYFDGKKWKERFWSINRTSRPDFFTVVPRKSAI